MSCYRWDIKWVDDTHALGVFSSAEVAAEALALRHPLIKSRPLNMATAQSKCKARAVCDYLLPYKPRPATSTAPARRLIQWALGSDKKVPAASKAEQDAEAAENEAQNVLDEAHKELELKSELVRGCRVSRHLAPATRAVSLLRSPRLRVFRCMRARRAAPPRCLLASARAC